MSSSLSRLMCGRQRLLVWSMIEPDRVRLKCNRHPKTNIGKLCFPSFNSCRHKSSDGLSASSNPLADSHPASPGPFTVITFYKFKKFHEPEAMERHVRACLERLEARGRIYFNKIGVNAQMCLPSSNTEEAKKVLREIFCEGLDLRLEPASFQVFNRLRVRVGKLLEGMDTNFDPSNSGRHVSPKTWNQMMDNKDENTIVLDVRNRYEWELGHFKDSVHPNLTRFSNFDEFARRFPSEHGREKKVLMYCTGGIRCELFSGLLKREGVEEIYQLDGGILNYGAQTETHNWRGKLFVFDDRLSVPLKTADEAESVISRCVHCGDLADTVYNCNNIACNNVFVSCDPCAHRKLACCSQSCARSGHYQFQPRNKQQVSLDKTVGRGAHFRHFLRNL